MTTKIMSTIQLNNRKNSRNRRKLISRLTIVKVVMHRSMQMMKVKNSMTLMMKITKMINKVTRKLKLNKKLRNHY